MSWLIVSPPFAQAHLEETRECGTAERRGWVIFQYVSQTRLPTRYLFACWLLRKRAANISCDFNCVSSVVHVCHIVAWLRIMKNEVFECVMEVLLKTVTFLLDFCCQEQSHWNRKTNSCSKKIQWNNQRKSYDFFWFLVENWTSRQKTELLWLYGG